MSSSRAAQHRVRCVTVLGTVALCWIRTCGGWCVLQRLRPSSSTQCLTQSCSTGTGTPSVVIPWLHNVTTTSLISLQVSCRPCTHTHTQRHHDLRQSPNQHTDVTNQALFVHPKHNACVVLGQIRSRNQARQQKPAATTATVSNWLAVAATQDNLNTAGPGYGQSAQHQVRPTQAKNIDP